MKLNSAVMQLDALIEAWDLEEVKLNQTDVNAIKKILEVLDDISCLVENYEWRLDDVHDLIDGYKDIIKLLEMEEK